MEKRFGDNIECLMQSKPIFKITRKPHEYLETPFTNGAPPPEDDL